MLVSHTHRFIYLKTVKTASTSVEVALEKYCLPPSDVLKQKLLTASETQFGIVGARVSGAHNQKWWNHMPGWSVKSLLPPEVWDGHYKFCNVRNPWDRAVSAFHFLNPGKNDFSLEALRAGFRDWLLGNQQLAPSHMVYASDDTLLVDGLIRYEALEADFAAVCETIGVPAPLLGRFKASKRPRDIPYVQYFDDETHAHIANREKFTIDLLGYRFGE